LKSNDLLFEKICLIQTEYRLLLEKIADRVSPDDISDAILDEINLFWSTRLDIVDLYLRNLPLTQDAYAFTGATYLDLDELEHYSQVLLGDIQILDDQAYIYANVVFKVKNPEFTQRMRKQIVNSIRSNLEILSKFNNIFLVLPLRSSDFERQKLIQKNMINAFLELFENPPNSMEEYFETYTTIDDLCNGLSDYVPKVLILSDTDELSRPFKERLNIALKDKFLSLGVDGSPSFAFRNIVFGYLGQALDIILSCATYKIIPYIRYSVAFRYVLLLSQNFSEEKEIQPMFFKCCLARVIYQEFDIERFKKVDFDVYYTVVKKSNFYQDLLSAFPVQSMECVSAKEMNNNVREKLEKFYSLFDNGFIES
jgi:hypothetical protein